MVIGIDASRANREKKTGVEWYAWRLIRELKAQSSQLTDQGVRFVLYSDKPLRGELAELPANWKARALPWPRLRSAGCAAQSWRFWTQIRMSCEMLVRPPDVLFVPSHVAPFIHPKKTVATIHDIAARRFPDSYSRFERWYTLWSARYAVRNLWKVIVPSQFVKSELEKLFNLMLNVAVVPHGYDGRYGKIAPPEDIERVLKKYNLQRPFLLSVGRLEERKNTRRIVEAFNQLEPQTTDLRLQLVLVGSPGYGYEKIQEAIAQSSNKHRIRLLGWVAPDDLAALMGAAEAFVFPSLSEGFGMPVLEALAAGTPVVCTRGSSLEEVGGDAAIYADSHSAQDIAAAMRRALADSSYREQLIQKGRERVKEFSWKKAARDTLDILLGK